MKIGFFARDGGPANMLEMVVEKAKERGHEVFPVFRQKPNDPWSENRRQFPKCDVVVVGFGSMDNEEENALAESLLAHGVKVVCMEDVPNAGLRADKRLAWCTEVLIATQHSDKKLLVERGYDDVVQLGPPPHWGASLQKILNSGQKKETFLKVVDGSKEQLSSNDSVVFYAGGKDANLNNAIVLALVNAMKRGGGVLAFKSHPAEKMRDEEAKDRDALLAGVIRLVHRDASIQDLMAAADVTVFASASTESIVGAYARCPMVFCAFPEVKKEVERLGNPGGRWCIEGGGAVVASDPERLSMRVVELLENDNIRKGLRMNQEENFPVPGDLDTTSRIITLLEEDFAQK